MNHKLLFITSVLLLCITPIHAQEIKKSNNSQLPFIELPAVKMMTEGSDFRKLENRWLGMASDRHQSTKLEFLAPAANARFDIQLHTHPDVNGSAEFSFLIGNKQHPIFVTPVATTSNTETPAYIHTWKRVEINEGENITLNATNASLNGKVFSQARWSKIVLIPIDIDPGKLPAVINHQRSQADIEASAPLVLPRQVNGDGTVAISGELKQWHDVILTLDGPYAHEQDLLPNPFTDYRMSVTFTHESGIPTYTVPGYFAADGRAAETSAEAGTQWRAHLSPDKPGKWNYRISFVSGRHAAVEPAVGEYFLPYQGIHGHFLIERTNKKGKDFRAKGRLQYIGGHYLRFADSGDYFLKAGPDAPETMLAYVDIDNTLAMKPNLPLKTWAPHAIDAGASDPTWKRGKGKNLLGALNYLSGKGINAFSFLTYNAGGDGDNIWPYVERNGKLHFDCSKLDQWNIVFSHAQQLGLYLHFKLQENELDDNREGSNKELAIIPESMDGGLLGVERKVYLRELIARYGHHLALNWNLGEENTQSYEEQRDMAEYIHNLDAYDHNLVIHSFPQQQEQVYRSLLGAQSVITGASLQNSWDAAHKQTLRWVDASRAAGKPWVVANDEQNSAGLGVPPDPGYQGFDGYAREETRSYNLHDIRKYTLWGNLMAGGAGVEYYFGYRLPQMDLNAEDFRSRDQSWTYASIAIDFFAREKIPFQRMQSMNLLIDNPDANNTAYCFTNPGEIYLIYLPKGGSQLIDLSGDKGNYQVSWFNPRTGGKLQSGSVKKIKAGDKVSTGIPPSDIEEDWLVVLRR